ncbi:autotransporter-associated beta strand repeat-containing protein [Variovorax sp. LARHSF232]
MNRIFRIVWSRALRAWVVASELATSHGRSSRRVERRAGLGKADRGAGVQSASRWRLRLGALAALLAIYAPAQAVDRYWDSNNTAVGSGGAGIWNTTSAFWSPNGDGVSGPYSAWNNAALDDAFFGGTAGTVTLGAPITVHNMVFLTNGYVLNGGTLTLGGVAPTITTNPGVITTINSVIAGSAGLTKAGTGWLFLTGANTFSGNINVNGGRLDVNGNAALGNVANVVNMANGTRLDVGSTGGGLAGRTVSLTGSVQIFGSGAGSGFFTGSGSAGFFAVAVSNDLNNYTGRTTFNSGSASSFTSIADLGMASSLGAPTTVADGTITVGAPNQTNAVLQYVGDGDSSNRNWQLNPPAGPSGEAVYLQNWGTGTLTLTGNIALAGGSGNRAEFDAVTADMELLGVISSNNGRDAWFVSSAGRTIRLGDANTFTGRGVVRGAGQVQVGTIANSGVASSLGAGTTINVSAGGTLSYTGTGASSDRNWQMENGTLNNNGSGALTLSGPMAITNTATLGGSFTGADNIFTGIVSGSGNLRSGGDATWVLTGANTYTGSTIVNGGVLRAGTSSAFGASTVAQVNGGTLDLNGFSRTFSTLSGTGGTVNLGSATLTLEAPTGTTASYAGSITGSGGLTKLGASTQTLTGANTYTGATTIGGGTLNLNFSPAGGPASNIIASASTLNMSGGTLNVTGAAGESNTQTFNGLNISAGNNTIGASAGSGGSMTVNLGAVTRTGGLMNFNLPASGNITTTSTALGGWATVNGTDYAKVVGGNITAFTAADYTNKDNAANWLANEFITDATGFFGTVNGSVQLGGLRYTRPVSTTVTVAPGETLGVDGTIIVAPSVLNTSQVITGGMLTGANGGDLGIQQNSTGNFTIDSQIVDNGSSMGFVKAGTGLVTLTNSNNSYTGATQVVQGTLSVNTINNGGVASSIGASAADPSNLSLEGATLSYTGASTTSDRGFTFAKSGGILGSGIAVTNAGTNLTFTGLVTSPDDAKFTKSGAGTLTLANGANDYVGGTTITGGLLSVSTLANGGQTSGIGQSSSASANLVLDGGGLQYTGATTTTNRGFTLGTNRGTIDVTVAATTLTVSGTAAGSGATRLIKEGAGTLVLSGTNTYVGGNTVNGGTLRAASTQAFGTPSTANVMTLANVAGVTLDLNNFNNFVGPLVGGGANGGNVTLGSATLRIGGGGGNYSGVISGTGGVWRTDGGTQTFNGCNNTYTGATTLQGAVLSVDCLANGGTASGIGASGSASTNLVFSNGNLNYTGGTVSIDRGFSLAGYGVIDVLSGTTLGFSGQVVGAGELYKDNAGTLLLSGINSYTSNTQVRGGTLRAGSNTAFGTTNAFIMANTAGVLLDLNSFNANAGALIGGGTAGGNIALGTGTLTIRDGFGQTYAGAISGTGNLIKNGAGTQTLSGCNSSYSGTTTINAGVLAVNCLPNGGVNSSIGASTSNPANLVLNGGTLRYVGAGDSTDRQFTLGTSGGTLDASGTGIIEFASTAPVTLAGANTARTLTLTGTNTGYNILAAQLDNNGAGITSLTKTGTGTWRLTNASSTYTGVTRINGGVLSVDQLANGGQASSIGASSNAAANLVIGNGSTLRYTGAGDSTDRQFTLDSGVTFIESSGSGALQFTNTGAVTLTGTNTARTIALGGTNTGNNTFGGTIGNNGTGATTLAKNDSGTWILTGNNTYTGNTVINDGNLVIGNGGTTGNAGAGNVIVDSATSTLSLNRSDTFTFNGTLSGPGTLAQIGAGTSVLTSASNSIGATTISAGTLQVNGAMQTPTVAMTGTSALTVNGTVQAAGGIPAALSGDAGNQTITVGTGGNLLAGGDLGGGNDTVNLTGTLNTGTGALELGDGNDTLVLNDGAALLGGGVDVAASGGIDSLVVNTVLGQSLDGGDIGGFDILTKQNTGTLTLTGAYDFSAGTTIGGGTLNVDGPLVTPTVAMADGTTLNVNGTVEDAGSTPATLTGSAGANTITVGVTGTLRADGDLGDGNDSVTLAGLLSTGAGTLALGAGDDVLTLQDGSFIESGDGGVAAGAGGNDQLILDNASAMVFDGGQTAGFETLLKQNSGTATMTGSQGFSNGTTIAGGTLAVAGALQTPTIGLADATALIVDGTVDAGAGTAAAITGSIGDNTVRVGAGGTLRANGDLGAGSDVLDVAGTLDTGAGVFALGDGNDTLTIHENTRIVGTVSAGAGIDTFDTHIDTVADLGAVQGFETLSKTGAGVLNINGPMSSDFTTVQVAQGILNVTAAGDVVPAPGSTLATIVASGATLNVDGSYGCGTGNDTMTVAGTVSGSGTIDLCGGDDTLTLQDGALLGNAISAGLGTADTLVLDNAGALAFDAGNTTNFELLRKDNVGTATLSGSQSFSGGTTIAGGVLDVDGTLETPTIDLADGTELHVDGIVQAGGPAATLITGSTGINAVTVGVGGTLRASGDLGAGADVLDVAGTLDTGGGVFALGDGDDNFVVHDGTVVNGTIDGGAGLDTRTYAINTSADLGSLVNFEGVTKTGAGVLNITGPGATALQDVQVLEGTLDVHAGASIVATAGSALNAIVASGATLNVGGEFGCGSGADRLDVSGTVSGSGTVNLCGGDDTLVLNDGANLAGLANPIDGDAGADRVVLNNAGSLVLDAGRLANFEVLQKDNTGEATLAGVHSFTGGTVLNGGTLTVDGTLETPAVAMGDNTVLNVDNQLSAAGGTAAVITGSSGANTVNVRQGGLLIASGDLGEGEDVLNVAGTLNTGGGVLALGGGSDTFAIGDGTVVLGTVDGGAGLDAFNPDINTSADLGALTNFEILNKTGSGVLNVNGPAQSDFVDVNVLAGTLNIGPAGGIGGVQHATVAGGATLNLDGNLLFTSGDDTLTVAGTVTGGGTLDMGAGNDTFTIQDGANLTALSTPVRGGAGTDVFVADLAGNATLGSAVDFETLTKTNVGTLHIAGPAPSAFTTVNVDGGTLDIGAAGSLDGVQDASVASGARMVVDGSLRFTPGADRFTVAGNVSGLGTLEMLDGDDTLTLQDGADLSGLSTAIDGGTGTDTLVADIAGSATLGGAANFETLRKTNAGTLTVAGPAPSDFTTVNVDGGTLDIGAAGSVGGVVTTTVAGGAALNVDGNYSGSSGNDTMTIAGAVRGAGAIALGDGDDVVTLHDGADLSGLRGSLDGGAHSGGDTVVLDNAAALSFGAGTVSNFEFLTKTHTGTATLVGTQSFSGGTVLNGGTLTVAGTLETPTVAMSDNTVLNVDNVLSGGGGVAAVITGSSGVNTVNVRGGLLVARGDLGDGADLLDVGSTLDTGGGVFALGAGDDSFVVHDGTVVNGTVDGGAGLDTRVYDINLAADLGALVNFEGVTKTGTGVLNITGPGATALQEVRVLGGTLNIGPAGSVAAIAGSPLDTVVAAGATLHVDGSYGCGDGNDTMRVAGTVSGTGTIDMCGGEDVLTLQDGAVLAATISGGGHGSGDTVVLDTAGAFSFDATRTTNFEILRKENMGEATLTGAQQYTGGTVLNGGTLTIAGQLGTPTVTMADNTVLNVGGVLQSIGGAATSITGSAGTNTVTVGEGGTLRAAVDLGDGDDSFSARGAVVGTLAFGAGNDTASFVGGDITGVAGLDGGDGGNDRLSFSALKVDADAMSIPGWERVNLLDGATMSLGRKLGLGGGVLAIDAASRLLANAGASIGGSVENAGTIVTGANRLAISGGYTGRNGALHVAVSPGRGTSGGLDIAGDVVGTTAVTFVSDGSAAAQLPTSIQVISSPNDDAATDGSFVAAGASDGTLRFAGSVHPWTLGKQGNGWYLNSAADVLLPEIGAYAALPSIAYVGIQDSNRLLFQRMAGIRGDTPRCGADETEPQRVYSKLTGECTGFWMAATYSDMKMGANPGFGFSGQNRGLYAGVDQLLEDHATRTWRGGVFVGFQDGDYGTSGANSTGLQVPGKAKVSINAPTFGGYGSMTWRSGTYVDVTATGQMATKAKITTADGYEQSIRSGSMAMNARLGHRFKPGDGWTVEPQLQLGVSWMAGDHLQDASGKQLTIEDAVLRTTRVAVRMEKVFEAAGGARIRPWATLGLQDTLGEKQSSVYVGAAGSGAAPLGFPNHDLGRTATLDIGVEAELNKSVNLFVVGSYDKSVDGSKFEQRQANLGVRIKW